MEPESEPKQFWMAGAGALWAVEPKPKFQVPAAAPSSKDFGLRLQPSKIA